LRFELERADPLDRELGSDEQALVVLFGLGVGPDNAVEAVPIANAKGREPELGGALDELLRVRGALEERKAGSPEELGKTFFL
jgi:hypothetical protein